MRCIIFGLSDEQIKLIRKYHRNRGVGVPSDLKLPSGKCFATVDVPVFITEIKELENLVEKVIFLSSIYLAPIVTSKECLKDFRNFAVKEIRAKAFSIREFLRHLRISEYSMIDFYLSREMNVKINEFVEKDIRRFWRIMDERGELVGYYLFRNPQIFSIALSVP